MRKNLSLTPKAISIPKNIPVYELFLKATAARFPEENTETLSIIHQILKNVTCTRMELVTLFMDHQFFKEAYPRLPNKAPNIAEFEKGLNEKPYVVDQIHIGEQGVFCFSGK
ncbi:MAG: hypothetical protein AB7J40_05790 [Candidatus Altimarinota bacterium]